MIDFIAKHPDSEGAAAFIPELGDLDAMKKAAAALSDNIKNGRMHDYYQNAIDGPSSRLMRMRLPLRSRQRASWHPTSPLTTSTASRSRCQVSKENMSSSTSGARCVWCVRGIPKMKEYYNKYKGKFEILSIDCNDSQEKWKAGVKKYELPRLHVYQPAKGDVQTTDLYAIRGFPTKILIGPDGKIIKTYVGEDPSFYTFLDKTFGK